MAKDGTLNSFPGAKSIAVPSVIELVIDVYCC